MDLSRVQIEQVFSSTQQIQRFSERILVRCMENEETVNLVIESLNRHLLKSDAVLKAKSLGYLDIVLPHCSKAVLKENVPVWINFCLSTSHSKEKNSSLRFNVLGTILELSSDVDELHKEIAKNYIPKIVTVCLEARVKRADSIYVLACLKQCLLKYSCSFYSKQIESFLLSYLHEKLPTSVVKEAGLCFHYLQQVGFPGLNNKNYSTNWSNQIDRLCSTIHNLFNVFLQETESFTASSEGFQLPKVPLNFDEIQRIDLYTSRLTNCIIFTKALLETKFNAPKEVNPHSILWIIQRGFSEHRCLSKVDSLLTAHYSILLNRLQVNLLFLLRSLLACLGHHVLMFSFAVTKIFMDCILIMETCECLQIDMKFQETFYTVLNFWLPIVKNQMNNVYQNKLLKFFVTHLEPAKKEITLSLSQNNHKSKKAKKKAITERTIAGLKSPIADHSRAQEIQAEQICNYILDSLKQLLACLHLDVKSETLKELYSLVMTLASDIQTDKAVHPYTNEICQRKLHEVLVAFFEQPNLLLPPPLRLCIKLLTNGQNVPHISYVCARGLNVLEKIAQPVCPSLYIFENSLLEIRKEGLKENGKKINVLDIHIIPPSSDKNQPVLIEENDKEKTATVVSDEQEDDLTVTEIINDGIDDEKQSMNDDCAEENSIIIMDYEDVQDDKKIVDDEVEDEENAVIEINDSFVADENESEEAELVEIEIEEVDSDSPPKKKSKTDEETDDCSLENAMDSFVDETNDY